MPRPNGYQSLHTSVISERGAPFEVQIRTEEMHAQAEEGIAAQQGHVLFATFWPLRFAASLPVGVVGAGRKAKGEQLEAGKQQRADFKRRGVHGRRVMRSNKNLTE
jgi:hypothetical protein